MNQDEICKNCRQTFQGEYCSSCGQKSFKRFSISYLWHGLRDDLFEIDGGLLLTFRELWTHPGTMVLNYINGATRKYYSPLKYLIFWTAIYLIIVPFTATSDSNFPIESVISNSNPIFSISSLTDFVYVWGYLMKIKTNIYLMGLIPFLTSTNYLFHKESRFNYTEILILHTYFCGQFAFVAIVMTLLSTQIDSLTIGGFRLSDLLIQVPYWYMFLKMQKEFFGKTWTISIFKGIIVLLIGTLLYLVVLYLIFNGFKYSF
jgi:hypothetical protein